MEPYSGRLACDGNGNLLADEGEKAGMPVALVDGQHVFIEPGSDSHNVRHHKQYASVQSTQSEDPDFPGYAGTKEDPTPGHEHHFGVTEDDAHYDPSTETGVKLKIDPDAVAAKITGHTEAYGG